MNTPLVSVVVLTYNSAKFVEETLASIHNQSYRNIELIITDDASTDDTLEICRNWLKNNWHRQNAYKIVETPVNTGIPANCNRGVMACKGIWVKMIAGDDILLNECIEKNVNFCINSGAEICFSNMESINENGNKLKRDLYHDEQIKFFFAKSQKEKYRAYLFHPTFLNIPSEFFSRNLYNNCQGFDERISLHEDEPFIFRVFLAGFDLNYFDDITVLYRKHNSNVSHNALFVKCNYLTFTLYREPELNKSYFGKIISFIEKNRIELSMKNNNKSLFNFLTMLHYRLLKFRNIVK